MPKIKKPNRYIARKLTKKLSLTKPEFALVAEIIKIRFGVGGRKPLTQREVASHLGISRSYISRLETKALATIKAELEKR